MHRVNEIPFVCYPVTDKKRPCDFYEGLFGLKIDQGYVGRDGFWSEADIGAGTLAICSFWKPSAEPSMGPAIAFEVENFETAVAELKAAGVPFAMEPVETPSATWPSSPIPTATLFLSINASRGIANLAYP
jgi:catechol 2,3-dioxygenase-like lactoylglutathione lyase family enzyme